MKVPMRNAEGYFDPTPYGAMTRIAAEQRAARPGSSVRRYRPLVFICSPYSDDPVSNKARALRYCHYAVQQGCIPIAPHVYFTQFLDDGNSHERDLGLFMGEVMLTKCAELWVFGDDVTPGMANEIAKATDRGMRIRHFGKEV